MNDSTKFLRSEYAVSSRCTHASHSSRLGSRINMMISIFGIGKTLVLGCCLFAISSEANDMHFTTMATVQENQVISSKEVKKVEDAWAWSQPETVSSVFSKSQKLLPNFVSSYYLPGQNLNRHEDTAAQRAEYFPYPYEAGPVEDGHHVSTAQITENAIGSITKHFAIVSFIGLLLLFAIVQNSISASKGRDALLSRRKRDIVEIHGLDPMTPEQEEILSDDTKVRCMQLTLCLENKKLRKRLGRTGKILAKYLTRTVKMSVESSSGWDRLLEDAGQAGLRGEDCRILYRDCSPSDVSEPKV